MALHFCGEFFPVFFCFKFKLCTRLSLPLSVLRLTPTFRTSRSSLCNVCSRPRLRPDPLAAEITAPFGSPGFSSSFALFAVLHPRNDLYWRVTPQQSRDAYKRRQFREATRTRKDIKGDFTLLTQKPSTWLLTLPPLPTCAELPPIRTLGSLSRFG